jgi:hypothetical protein
LIPSRRALPAFLIQIQREKSSALRRAEEMPVPACRATMHRKLPNCQLQSLP